MQGEHKTRGDLLSLLPNTERVKGIVNEILDASYETNARYVNVGDKTTKYGYAFPMQPEILYDLMMECKDKVVLELAAACGDNAILIGLAGAKEVHINDNAIPEMKACSVRVSKLPKEYRSRFKLPGGDCFKLFESEEYNGKFDVIYARNFYHFFLGEKKKALNKLFVRLLKPGGKLILTTNSVNTVQLQGGLDMVKAYPESYVFENLQPILRSSVNVGNDKLYHPTQKPLSPEEGEKRDPLAYEFKPLMTFVDGSIKTTAVFTDLNSSSRLLLTGFMRALIENNGVYFLGDTPRRMNLRHDMLEVHSCSSVMYSHLTLPKQFKGIGLIATKVISTNFKGHTTNDNHSETSLTVICLKIC